VKYPRASRWALTFATLAIILWSPNHVWNLRGSHTVLAASAAPQQTLSPDKGKFRDMVNGRRVGSEEFEISQDGQGWVAHATADVKDAKGSTTHITSTLRLRADGTPIHYEWSTEGPKKASSAVDFDNGTATIQLQIPGKNPYTQQLFFKSPRVAILDDNLYYQYSILASLYDWSKGGPQDISVLIPQELTPGSITMEALDPENDNGKSLSRLRVHSQDLDLTLYFDSGRLARISVPSSNAEIVRE
jgi:hypothetical protein